LWAWPQKADRIASSIAIDVHRTAWSLFDLSCRCKTIREWRESFSVPRSITSHQQNSAISTG
jgi:hypothetical protein